MDAVQELRSKLFLAGLSDDRRDNEAVEKIGLWAFGEPALGWNAAEKIVAYFHEKHGWPADKIASFGALDLAVMLPADDQGNERESEEPTPSGEVTHSAEIPAEVQRILARKYKQFQLFQCLWKRLGEYVDLNAIKDEVWPDGGIDVPSILRLAQHLADSLFNMKPQIYTVESSDALKKAALFPVDK